MNSGSSENKQAKELESLKKELNALKEENIKLKDRIKNESDLLEVEKQYKQLFELSPEAIVILNLKGVVTSCNKAFYRMSGLEEDEIIGKHFSKLPIFSLNQIPKFLNIFSSFFTKKPVKPYHYSWTDKQGRVHQSIAHVGLLYKNGKIIGIQAVTRDVTELMEYKNELSTEKIRTMNILSVADILLLTLDENANIEMISRKGCEILKDSRENLIGKNWIENFVPEKERKMVRKVFRDIMKGKVEFNEYVTNQIIDSRGEQRTIKWHNSVIKDENGKTKGTFSSGEDITEKLVAQEMLMSSEERFRQVFDNMGSGVVIYEAVNEGEDFIIKDINKAGLSIGRQKKEEVLGRYVTEVYPGVADTGLLDAFKRVYKTGKAEEFPLTEYQDDRIKLWVNNYIFKLTTGEIIAVYEDESENKKAEDLILESEQRLKTEIEFTQKAINAQIDTFFVFDPETGKAIRWNKAFEKVSGYSADEIEKLPAPASYYSKDDIEKAIPFVEETMKKKSGQINLDLITKDGKEIPFEYSVSTMTDVVNKRDYLVSVGRDISEWKKAQEILLRNQKQLQGLFDYMMNGFAFHKVVYNKNKKAVNYTFLEINTSFEKMTGLKREKVVGKNVTDVLPGIEKEDADWIGKYGEVATSGKPISFENYSQSLDKWFRINAYSPEKGYFATTFEDITEKKKNEIVSNVLYNIALAVNLSPNITELSKAIKNELSEIIDTTNFYIALYNMDKDSLFLPLHIDEKDKIGKEYPAGKTLTKYVLKTAKTQLLTNKDIEDLVKKEEVIRVASPSKCWLGIPLKYEDEVIGVLGLQSYTAEDAYSKSDINILEFISEHIATSIMLKNAQDLLKDNELRYRVLANATDEAVFISEKGVCIDTNEAASRMFGYTYDEIIGIFGTDVIAPESKELVKKNMMSGFEEPYEAIAIRKDGSKFPAMFHGKMYEYRGKIIRLTTCRDLSRQKQYEEELVKAKEKAEESDNLKSAFLANMSHEIRTPLNGIIGFSSIICEQDVEEEKRDQYLRIINNCGDQLLSIINNVLDISRMETGQIEMWEEEFILNDMIKNLFEQFNPKCRERGLSLSYSLGLQDDGSKMLADKNKLNQVMNNLLDNAIKFTESGEISMGYTLKDKMIILFVKDTGIGISKEKQKAVFDRFSQAEYDSKREYGGAGLGLAITKSLVEIMGGEISLKSEPGEGSEFIIMLPATLLTDSKKELKDSLNDSDTGKKSAGGMKILVAEDDESNFIFINEVMKLIGMEVIHALDGEQALKYMRENPDIGLVLMDMKMPGMNGFEATPVIKKEFPEIPVIAQTAYAFAEDKEKAMKAGCDDYVSKPIMKNELIEIISKYIKVKD